MPPTIAAEAPRTDNGLLRGHPGTARGPHPLFPAALDAHRAGLLSRAEALYRRVLTERPGEAEALHMLGVLEFERMHHREALELLVDANERVGWTDSVFRQNLGLVLAKLVGPRADARQQALVERYLERERARKAAPVAAGQVSVVLLAEGPAPGIAMSVESIAAQTAANIELVVAAGDRADVAHALATWRDAATAIVVDAQGLAQAANRGAERASGSWIAFIEAGDRYAPERIERMAAEIARAEPLWGFSRVGRAEDAGRVSDVTGTDDGKLRPGDYRGDEPASFTLLHHDIVGAVGNLFVERELFLALGGIRDVDDPAWEFALCASRIVEPVSVPARLYFCADRSVARGWDSVPGAARGRAASGRATGAHAGDAEGADIRVAGALDGDPGATNVFCPQHPANRDLVLRDELRAGRGDRIPVDVLRATVRSTASTASAASAVSTAIAARAADDAKVALVVLGVYRSGTSAIARALNLCGAALPERLIAPRLGINPKGFWEAEAVTDLDVRLLNHLGADWSSLDVALPGEGPLVDEFLDQARELLAREYGDARLILIKDPRISMLAPLWHRALVASAYRPAYLVAVRHPLEVARSFEGQGDMPVEAGLALWHAYMQRVESFAAVVDARVAWLRYTALLDDWRRALECLASRLDVALDTRSRAREIDAFLDRGMRNYRAEDARPGSSPTAVARDAASHDAALAGERWGELRALYQRLVVRCDADAADQSLT